MQLVAYGAQDVFFFGDNDSDINKIDIHLISSSFTPKKKHYCSICLDNNKAKIIKFNICKHSIEEWIQNNNNTCLLATL